MTVTLEILKNVYGGDGLARLGDGRVCFVAGAFAGETVKAKIFEEKKSFVRAEMVEILKPSPDRITRIDNAVPGMVYADVTPEAEMEMKREQLDNFLWKVQKSPVPLEVCELAAEKFLNYRNKAVYHIEKRGNQWYIGYRKEPSHEVVDVENDPLVADGINAAIPSVRSSVMSLLTQGSSEVRKAASANTDVTIRWTRIDGAHWWMGKPTQGLTFTEQTAGLKFKVAAGGFYQVNPLVGDDLVKTVRDIYLEKADRYDDIIDLYCGVGVFGIVCAKAAIQSGKSDVRLIGIESEHKAIDCAKKNAAQAGVEGKFFCEDVGRNLHRIRISSRHTVIIDPPRGGLEKQVPKWLANGYAPRIIYVSCDPATLTRDLMPLSEKYEIKKAVLFNMFPRTARFESVVVLERKPRRKKDERNV